MRYRGVVKYWLLAGCFLLFMQIFIGGITRITGSGLSITKWEIVTGSLPPMSEQAWMESFDLYKATPQYEKINQGISLSKFKFIYFWEYLHRLWARIMGIIFIVPFLIFSVKGWLDKWMFRQLGFMFFFACLAAVFGWIMVASGLVDRPWVNAYKLSLHLGIALCTYSFLLWATIRAFDMDLSSMTHALFHRRTQVLLAGIILQIFFGAVVSGMRAALYYPTWPDIGGSYIPSVLFDSDSWSMGAIVNYDQDALMPALIHVLHRYWGYTVYVIGIVYSISLFRYPLRRRFYVVNGLFLFFLNLQVVVGILILLNSQTTIPIFYGIIHQSIAIFILSALLCLMYLFKRRTD